MTITAHQISVVPFKAGLKSLDAILDKAKAWAETKKIDPNALLQCLAAKEMYDFLGSPEGEIGIVQACIYLATAPKSNATYLAQKGAWRAAKESGSLMPPSHILNAPTKLMKDIGYGKGYAYDHDVEEGFSGQDYWPEEMESQEFYRPSDRGFEARVRERLEYWAERRKALQSEKSKQGS